MLGAEATEAGGRNGGDGAPGHPHHHPRTTMGRMRRAKNRAQMTVLSELEATLWASGSGIFIWNCRTSSPTILCEMLCLYLNTHFSRKGRSMKLFRFSEESKAKSRLETNNLVV